MSQTLQTLLPSPKFKKYLCKNGNAIIDKK
jgi:hypothetical protein